MEENRCFKCEYVNQDDDSFILRVFTKQACNLRLMRIRLFVNDNNNYEIDSKLFFPIMLNDSGKTIEIPKKSEEHVFYASFVIRDLDNKKQYAIIVKDDAVEESLYTNMKYGE